MEGTADALSTMAAYVDLNAVRAGIVEDPKDYRFCGYGEAEA
jgi:putative transposase